MENATWAVVRTSPCHFSRFRGPGKQPAPVGAPMSFQKLLSAPMRGQCPTLGRFVQVCPYVSRPVAEVGAGVRVWAL